jgi:hypothetical protein
VRGYFGGIHYAWNGGKLERKGRLSVPLQGQGESVTYSADGSRLLFGSEGEQSGVVSRPAPGADESGSSGGPGSRADGGDSAAEDGKGDSVKVGGAVVVAVLVAALFGLSRRRRKG